jgi:hypothetical protein
MLMMEPVRYRIKGTQSGIGMLRYRTEIQDAGIPMPAASNSRPMPSYGNNTIASTDKGKSKRIHLSRKEESKVKASL